MKLYGKFKVIVILLFFGTVLRLTYLFASDIWRVDLFFYIEAARTMLDGGVLYKHFGDSHPTLGYFEFFWMAKLFGYENIYLTIKVFTIVFQTVMAFLVYLIFSRIHTPGKGLVYALLFIVILTVDVNLWPHNIPFTYLLPVFAGIFFLLKDDFKPGVASLFLAGIMFACATLISTNVIFYTLLVPIVTSMNYGFKMKYILRDGIAAFTGFLIPFFIFAVYFYLNDALGDWYFWGIISASTYSGYKSGYMNIVNLFYGLIKLWRWTPFIILTFFALYKILKDKLYKSDRYLFFVLGVLICAFLSKYIMNKSVIRYNLYLLPGIIFSLDAGFTFLKDKYKKFYIIITSIFIVVILIQVNFSAWENPYDESFNVRNNLKEWIKKNTTLSDRIFVWSEGYEIYYETKRKRALNSFFSPGEDLDKAKLWRNNNFKNTDKMWEKFLGEFRNSPPEYIVDLTLNFEEDNLEKREGIHKYFYDRFISFVNSNYQVSAIIDGRYRVLKRNIQ